MKMVLNFTEDKTHNGFRAAFGGAVVVRVETDAATVNELILSKVNVESLTKEVKKGKSAKQATATLIWRAVRAIIEAQANPVDGILMPNSAPKFVHRKLKRKLNKHGLTLFVESDIR